MIFRLLWLDLRVCTLTGISPAISLLTVGTGGAVVRMKGMGVCVVVREREVEDVWL